VQDCIAHSGFRDSLLLNLWQAYNAVSETAVNVAFQSSILDLAQLREDQAAELTVMRESLTKTQGDASSLEQTLVMITGARYASGRRRSRKCVPNLTAHNCLWSGEQSS
jgi:hypothetical protein